MIGVPYASGTRKCVTTIMLIQVAEGRVDYVSLR